MSEARSDGNGAALGTPPLQRWCSGTDVQGQPERKDRQRRTTPPLTTQGSLKKAKSRFQMKVNPKAKEQEKLDTEGVAMDVLPNMPTGIDRLVIRPGNRLVWAFDVLIALCVVYTAIIEPLKVSYRTQFVPALEIFFDVCFILDMCLQCLEGFVEGGYPVRAAGEQPPTAAPSCPTPQFDQPRRQACRA